MRSTKRQNQPSTAVLLLGFKRIDLFSKRLNQLSRNVQIPIFVSIDGSDIATQNLFSCLVKDFISENPEMKISFKVHEKNLGLTKHVTTSISEVLNEFDQIIVIEDDIILSENFIANMLNGLYLAKNANNIGVVGGFSAFSSRKSKFIRPKWRKSMYFPAWGWGITRECWSHYQLELPPNFLDALSHSRTWQSQSSYKKKVWTARFTKVANNNLYTWDYQMQYLLFRRDMMTLLSTSRISDNEGFESVSSTNTKSKRPRWMREERVFDGMLQTKISRVSKLYQVGDALTFGGDIRIVRSFALLRKLWGSLGRKRLNATEDKISD
jgi:hypothetical protein